MHVKQRFSSLLGCLPGIGFGSGRLSCDIVDDMATVVAVTNLQDGGFADMRCGNPSTCLRTKTIYRSMLMDGVRTESTEKRRKGTETEKRE